MIAKQHLIFAAITSLIIAVAFFNCSLPLSFLFAAGCLTGVIMPDIHMKKSHHSIALKPVYWIASASGFLFVPAIRFLYSIFPKISPDAKDKRMTHSIPGIMIIAVITAIILGIIALLLKFAIASDISLIFFILFYGIIAGLILHLTEDACTFKGIYPLFPFRDMKISGNIQPCNKTDNRIPYYQTGFLFILALTTALKISYYDTDYPALMAIFGIAIITGAMFIFSKIQK
ncbi:MAG: metal-dependent hydrolase, partial [Methanomicrobium sp.]|nr:metal-dependent hydrolase [Methanomicrobium sp.]